MQAIHFQQEQRFHFLSLSGVLGAMGEVELFRVQGGNIMMARRVAKAFGFTNQQLDQSAKNWK